MQRDSKGQFIKGGISDRKNGKDLSCKLCGKIVYVPKYRLKTFSYCSRKCSAQLAYKNRIYKPLSKEIKDKISNNLTGRFRGEDSPHWKGGRILYADGYIYIYSSNHPYKDSHGYVFEHRLIVEKEIKRYLLPSEHIHHINGNKQDNRIENLKILTNSEHLKLHWQESENNNFKNAKKTQFSKGNIPWNKI